MGVIADRTHSRFGKFRPYLIIGPALIALTTVLCFVNFGGSPVGTAIVAALWILARIARRSCPTCART